MKKNLKKKIELRVTYLKSINCNKKFHPVLIQKKKIWSLVFADVWNWYLLLPLDAYAK